MTTFPFRLHPDDLADLARLIAAETSPIDRIKPYTAEEAAAALNISITTVYSRVKSGMLPSIPNLGRVRIPAKEMEKILKEGA